MGKYMVTVLVNNSTQYNPYLDLSFYNVTEWPEKQKYLLTVRCEEYHGLLWSYEFCIIKLRSSNSTKEGKTEKNYNKVYNKNKILLVVL